MKYYFFSPIEVSLCCGNKFLGKVTKNITTVEEENAVFTLFAGENYFPSYLAGDAPVNGKVYNFYSGKLFIPSFVKRPEPYRLICEKQAAVNGVEIYARLYADGSKKLDVFILSRRYTLPVPIEADNLEIINCGNSILFELTGMVKHIILISQINFNVIFSATCASYEIKDTLSVTKAYVGTKKYLYSEHYKVDDKVTLLGKSLKDTGEKTSCSPMIKKLEFLQLVKLYGDYRQFLSPSLLPKADDVKNFLGDYKYLIPPVEKDFPAIIAAITENGVKYIDITLENDLIADISVDNYPK